MTALDTRNENAIQQEIRELQKNRTVLVIAHRISTARSADRIIALHDGQLIEAGDFMPC